MTGKKKKTILAILRYFALGLIALQILFQSNAYLIAMSVFGLVLLVIVHIFDVIKQRQMKSKIAEQREAITTHSRHEKRLKSEMELLKRESKFHKLLQKLFEDTSGKQFEEIVEAVINILKVAVEGSFVFYFEKDVTGKYSLVDGSVSNIPSAALEVIFSQPSVQDFMDKKSSGLLNGINFKLGKLGVMNSAWVIPLVKSSGEISGAIFIMYPMSDVSLELMTETWLLERNIALIIELATIHEAERKMAFKDALTGAYNRNFMNTDIQKDINKAKARGDKIYISIFDIDNFKKFNDTYGHDAGDVVLKTVVQVVKSKLRPSDYLVRYGGEEFIIIILKSEKDAALEEVENVRVAISEIPLNFEGKEVRVTCSFGFTRLTSDKTLEEAITTADKGLYRAKANGKNRIEIEGDDPEEEPAEVSDAIESVKTDDEAAEEKPEDSGQETKEPDKEEIDKEKEELENQELTL